MNIKQGEHSDLWKQQGADAPEMQGIKKYEIEPMFTQQIRRSIGLAVHHGWAKLLLGRCRDLVQDPRQPRTQTREADEVGAEAHEYFHSTIPAAGAATTANAFFG